MSKRPITFNKPEDPSFLKQIKASIGYKEGPTVETKRQKLEEFDSGDEDEEEQREAQSDYKPQVVVLRAGDLTEEEAEREKQRLLREEQEKPADLSQRVVFKKPKKALVEEGEEVEAADSKDPKAAAVKKGRKKEFSSVKASSSAPGKLSFAQDEEEEEGDF